MDKDAVVAVVVELLAESNRVELRDGAVSGETASYYFVAAVERYQEGPETLVVERLFELPVEQQKGEGWMKG